MTGTCRPGKRRSGMRSCRTHTRTAARTQQRLASRIARNVGTVINRVAAVPPHRVKRLPRPLENAWTYHTVASKADRPGEVNWYDGGRGEGDPAVSPKRAWSPRWRV